MAPYDKLPPSWFTPPGIINVSVSAMHLARKFAKETRRAQPDQDWVISFDWWDSRRVRTPGNQWDELGAGLGLAAYERHKVPASAIEIFDGMEILIKIDSSIWQQSRDKLIDIDENKQSEVILR